ncbi:MAG: glycine oxidase ThiO [gamma proteobacterium symbiont of Bathyaustriella thionipta]|nr:glycine oxidase ThiO [gamma proteobacterium symbiont of Bathyaustriella thionipta]
MSHNIIIGAGAIGLMSALELLAAGDSVHIFEQNLPGQESSWAGGGILSPLYPWRYAPAVNALARWSQDYYPKFSNHLKLHNKTDPEWVGSGLLLPALGDEYETAVAWADRYGLDATLLKQPALGQSCPSLSNKFDDALWLPQIAQSRNPRLCQALLEEALRCGVKISTHHPVEQLQIQQHKACGVMTRQGLQPADRVIVCAGAWTTPLLNKWPQPPQISPVKGQMLLFKAPAGLLEQIVLYKDRYAIPRLDGHILFGSTLEQADYDKQTSREAREDLLAAAYELIPGLQDYPMVKQWAGLRPSSPNGIPYIGPHPEISGLFINSGQYRNGLVTGPASARLLADLVLQREPIIDPKPYALDAVR